MHLKTPDISTAKYEYHRIYSTLKIHFFKKVPTLPQFYNLIKFLSTFDLQLFFQFQVKEILASYGLAALQTDCCRALTSGIATRSYRLESDTVTIVKLKKKVTFSSK